VSSGFLVDFFFVPRVLDFEVDFLVILDSIVCKVSSSDFSFSSLIPSVGLFSLVFFRSPAED